MLGVSLCKSSVSRSLNVNRISAAKGFVHAATNGFLTLCKPIRIMNSPNADVAELADAQVSEACDGDIVEVQVLSSAPAFRKKSELSIRGSL
jgi:hypothetical protein